eukprot:1482566-Ditylum_brightwellii.AAC.1
MEMMGTKKRMLHHIFALLGQDKKEKSTNLHAVAVNLQEFYTMSDKQAIFDRNNEDSWTEMFA